MFPYYLRHRKQPAPAPSPRKTQKLGGGLAGSIVRIALYSGALVALSLAATAVLPWIPTQYNILAPLDPAAPGSPLSRMKLARATRTPEQCLAVLEGLGDIRFARLPDQQTSDVCHIRGHVLISGLNRADLAPVSTNCGTALRLYLWERHTLQAAARTHLGAEVAEVGHLSSYACRKTRTERGEGDAMSAHATADAIDVTSVTLTDGRHLDVLNGWGNSDSSVRSFWRAAHSGGCTWFGTVLGPDFNRLHEDHLHLGQDRSRVCR